VSKLFAFILEKANDALQAHNQAATNSGAQSRPRRIDAGFPFTELPAILEELSRMRIRSRSEIGFGLRSFRSAIRALRHPNGRGAEIAIKLISSITSLLLFTGITVTGILSANVVLDSTALCISPKCGWYFIPSSSPTGRAEVPDAVVKFFLEKENAAAMHEARCYGNAAPPNCDGLITNEIPYNTYDGTPCPFLGNVCSEGLNSAFTLDTGHVDAGLLGIVSQAQFTFRRITSCAPLVTNATYIKNSNEPKGKGSVSYQYGSRRKSADSYHSANPLEISDVGISGYIL